MDHYEKVLWREINKLAYELFDRNGRIEGRDIDNWIEAEQIVFARHVEKVSQKDEDEACRGMLFEGSEC